MTICLYGFTDKMTALQRGKVEKYFTQRGRFGGRQGSDGIGRNFAEAVRFELTQGATPEYNAKGCADGYVLCNNKTNKYLSVSKTEYDFARYLIANDLASNENADEWRKRWEAEQQRKAEEAEQRKREEEEREQAELDARFIFENKFRSNARQALQSNPTLLQSYRAVTRKFFANLEDNACDMIAARVYALLGMADDDRAIASLKELLETRNKASRHVFESLTKCKLPSTIKGTDEFIDARRETLAKISVMFR